MSVNKKVLRNKKFPDTFLFNCLHIKVAIPPNSRAIERISSELQLLKVYPLSGKYKSRKRRLQISLDSYKNYGNKFFSGIWANQRLNKLHSAKPNCGQNVVFHLLLGKVHLIWKAGTMKIQNHLPKIIQGPPSCFHSIFRSPPLSDWLEFIPCYHPLQVNIFPDNMMHTLITDSQVITLCVYIELNKLKSTFFHP